MTQPFVFLDEQATASLLTMQEVVDTCEAVLLDQGSERAHLSEPAAMFLIGDPDKPTKFKAKGGYLPGLDACGFRVVGDVGMDGQFGECHYCLLLDPSTAKPRALVAQTELHRMRTAACALVALRHLASTATRTVALVGSGRIGAHFAAGFHDVFPEATLIIASRRIESATALADRVRTASRRVEAAIVQEALASAEGIVTLTNASEPVVAADVLRPGMTIVGMGEHHELPAGLLRQADRFVVDDFGFAAVLGSLSAWLARGDVERTAAAARVDATLGAIVAKRAIGRRSDTDKVLAIVQGLAIADLGLTEMCRRRAIAEQGQTLSAPVPKDAERDMHADDRSAKANH
jgi:ornithine cyclodeaminase/alanine dehydrogenase-like protein (mu-crystallin family)